MTGKLNVEVQVCTGAEHRPVREYAHQGRVFIEGKANLPFVIKIRNSEPRRLKAIVSVDGLNVISGQPASDNVDQPGYVVPALGVVRVDGWRTSNQDVASFFFTERGKSYAAATQTSSEGGGVIGVAFVEEKPVEPAPASPAPIVIVERAPYPWQPWYIPRAPAPTPWYWTTCSGSTCNTAAVAVDYTTPRSGSVQCSLTLDSNAAVTAASSVVEPTPFNLGAGWGSQVSSPVTEVPFNEHRVADVVVLYYTDAPGLVTLGIDVHKTPGVTFPAAFNGYCRPPTAIKT